MKNYNEMTSKEKAQTIMDNASSEELQHLIFELSYSYDDYGIQTVDDWLESFTDGTVETDIVTLIKVAQQSKDLDVCDTYIRESVYYYGYKTSDNVLDLVSEDEAIDWIAIALEANDPMIDDLNSRFEIEGYLKDEA